MIRFREFDEEVYLVMVTRGGTVKRMRMAELKNIRNVGIRALTLEDDDELISVRETDGSQKILIATHDGMAICFCETDLRPMGRTAMGVRGIRLRKGTTASARRARVRAARFDRDGKTATASARRSRSICAAFPASRGRKRPRIAADSGLKTTTSRRRPGRSPL
jgi:DNA gyrase/topoisomerase IV subunit A